MDLMDLEELYEEAIIAYYESGTYYELDVDMGDWCDEWVEER